MVRSRRSVPTKRTERHDRDDDEKENKPDIDDDGDKTMMDSPGLTSETSPDDHKDTEVKTHPGVRRNDDYESFRFAN